MADPFATFKQHSETKAKNFFDRTPTKTVAPRPDGPAVVIDRVELTAALGQPLAGYGITFNRHTRGWMHPQYATLILTDDGMGHRYLLLGLDLHAGTRWLAESIALVTAPSIGVGIDRLFLTATHSHSGPGNFYGVRFYDNMVCNAGDDGIDQDWGPRAVDEITKKAKEMAKALENGAGRNPRLGYGESTVWGPIWQRALCAHVANFGLVAKMDDAKIDAVVAKGSLEINGEAAPAQTTTRRQAVDARVRCLTWEADGQPIGVLAFVGVTPTMFHANAQLAGGDGLGYAARYAEEALAASSGKRVLVSANGSAHGDTFLGKIGNFNEFTAEREEAWKSWGSLAEFNRGVVQVGARVGMGMQRAIALGQNASAGHPNARAAALSPVPTRVHFSEELLAGAPCRYPAAPVNGAPLAPGTNGVDPPNATISAVGVVADAMLAGDPLESGLPNVIAPRDWPTPAAHSPPPSSLVRGVRNTFDATDPQSPKTTSLFAHVAARLGGPPEASFSPFCTLRAAHFTAIGGGKGLTLVGLPFEPTTRGAFEIERAVVGGPVPTDRALIACLAGDYLGYLPTREEYMAQLYEAGSAWFGRNTHKWVLDHVLSTVSSPPSVKLKRAWFTSPKKAIQYSVPRAFGLVQPDAAGALFTMAKPSLSNGPDGKPWLTLAGSWAAAPESPAHPRAGEEAWLRLHLRPNAASPATLAHLGSGLPADDKCGWISLFRDRVDGENFVRWRWQFHAPLPAGWSGRQVTFQVVSALPGVKPLKVTPVFVDIP